MRKNIVRVLNKKRTFYVIAICLVFALLFALLDVCWYRYSGGAWYVGPSWDFAQGSGTLSSYKSLAFVGSILMQLLLPLLLPFLVSDSYYSDSKQGIIPVIFSRKKNYAYFLEGILSSFLLGAFFALLILSFYKIFLIISLPFEMNTHYVFLGKFKTDIYFDDALFPNVYLSNPYMYLLCMTIVQSVFLGIIAALAYAFSMNNSKHKVVAIGLPSIIILALNQLTTSGIHWFGLLFEFNVREEYPFTPYTPLFIIIATTIILFITGLRKNKDYLK